MLESGKRDISRTVLACSGDSTEWGKQDSNLRRLSHQIYSLAPLATREFPRLTGRPPFGPAPTVLIFNDADVPTPGS